MPRRVIVSYEKMSDILQEMFREKYPRGYSDYMEDLISIDKPDGSYFTAISLVTEDTSYLIKMPLKVDDYEEAEKDIFNDGNEDEDGGGNDVFPEDGTENLASEPDSDEE